MSKKHFLQKPTLPKGTRDFGPAQMAKRNFILDTIREVFSLYGYQPLETPSMENLSVLTGKYGDEGDKLIFRILDSGDFFSPVKTEFSLNAEEVRQLTDFFNAFFEDIVRQLTHEEKGLFTFSSKAEVFPFSGPPAEIDKKEYSKKAERKIKEGFAKAVATGDHAILKRKDIGEQLQVFLEEYEVADIFVDVFSDLHLHEENLGSEYSRKLEKFKKALVQQRVVPYFTAYFTQQSVEKYNLQYIIPFIAEKGLRYDLTVPFARYVVMNQHEITFPFKRYQIQPVWRADRPQKGRYREFYQCDADVVGTTSLLCEAEIVGMIAQVFRKLNLQDFTIKINNRKLLQGVVEAIGAQGKETDLLVAIDKLDKVGQEKVWQELRERGFTEEALTKLTPIFSTEGSNEQRMDAAIQLLQSSETGRQGLAEVQEVFERVQDFGWSALRVADIPLEFDMTLARGLSYYTGAIFEVKVNNASLTSSVSGGGRYDNLTGVFGLPDVSGVGISFGVDRLYDVMEELDLFPPESLATTQVLLINFDRESEKHALGLLFRLRDAGIRAEIYPEAAKLKKQLTYADKKGIPFALLAGTEEIKNQRYGLKDLRSGEQTALSLEEIISLIRQ